MSRPILSDLDFNSVSRINNLPDAVSAQQPATFAQLNAAIEGLKDKGTAVVATQANLNLSSPGASIDSYSPVLNDLILVRAQSTDSENGLYVYNGAAIAMTRAPNMNTSTEFNNALIPVANGTSAGITYRQTALNPTVGVTSIVFIVFGSTIGAATESSAGIAEIATQAEVNAGTDDARFITPLKLSNYTGALKKFSSVFGDGSATQYDITHNLNTLDVNVEVNVVSSGDTVLCDVKRLSVNIVRLNFSSAPSLNYLKCVVIG